MDTIFSATPGLVSSLFLELSNMLQDHKEMEQEIAFQEELLNAAKQDRAELQAVKSENEELQRRVEWLLQKLKMWKTNKRVRFADIHPPDTFSSEIVDVGSSAKTKSVFKFKAKKPAPSPEISIFEVGSISSHLCSDELTVSTKHVCVVVKCLMGNSKMIFVKQQQFFDRKSHWEWILDPKLQPI